MLLFRTLRLLILKEMDIQYSYSIPYAYKNWTKVQFSLRHTEYFQNFDTSMSRTCLAFFLFSIIFLTPGKSCRSFFPQTISHPTGLLHPLRLLIDFAGIFHPIRLFHPLHLLFL